MTIDDLINRWRLPQQFRMELFQILTSNAGALTDLDDLKSEAAVANECRLVCGRLGVPVWRNNVGVLDDINGRPVRYGLANESKQMNKIIKSGDDIGIFPYTVRPQDVGRTLGVFISVEHKRRNWVYTGRGRESAQATWQTTINNFGGVGLFATCGQDIIDRLVKEALLLPEQLTGLNP